MMELGPYAGRVIDTEVDLKSATFRQNEQAMSKMVSIWRQRIEKVKLGGGAEVVARHKARGKMTARERIEALVDPGTALLELSTLAAWEMYEGSAPGAGVVTCIGRVSGNEVMIVANDATVKGGTYFPITVKKHLRAQ